MRISEKARLYDELMKDVKDFMDQIQIHYDQVEKIKDNEELIEAKEKNLGSYYPRLCGTLQGTNFGLALKLNRFKGVMGYYENQK